MSPLIREGIAFMVDPANLEPPNTCLNETHQGPETIISFMK